MTTDEAERLLAACRLAGGHPDELRLLRTEVDSVKLYNSGTSATYEVTFADASRAAFKSIEGVEATAAGYGHTAASVILNDLASWLVARGLGFEALLQGVVITTCPEPAVGIGSMQTWLDGQASGLGWENAGQLRDAGLFDAVTGQQDRNGGNFAYDDTSDELGLFDQSFTFPLPGHQQGASEIVNRLHADGKAQLDQALTNALDRLEASPEFAEVQQVLARDRFARMVERIALIRQKGHLLQGRRILKPWLRKADGGTIDERVVFSMVSVTVFQPLPGDGVGFLASITVSKKKVELDGPRQDLVDTTRPMYSPRTADFVTFDEDQEEWVRAFAENFRTAQVVAAIVKDTQHKELVAPLEVIQRLEHAQLAAG